MIDWSIYTDRREHTVEGVLHIAHNIYSPQLDNTRDVLIHLPPSYHSGEKRYPVFYMHDGQNLFDAHTSFSGEWNVDETMQQLAGEGLEAIIVGIASIGDERINEYNPYPSQRFKDAHGDAYVHFIVDTLKPLIDTDFRTLPDAAQTGIIGSSMGGLISLYAWLAYPWKFGLAGVMSPSLWVAKQAVYAHASHAPFNEGRLYLDMGTREMPRKFNRFSDSLVDSVLALRDQLHDRGYNSPSRFKYVQEHDGEHNEAAWSRRLPDVLRFLLKP